MQLVDTHVHLEDDAFAGDREKVINQARNSGMQWMLNAGSTQLANPKVLALAQAEPDIYAGIGLHPHEFPATPDSALKQLPDQLSAEKVVALGEIGLDYHVFSDFPKPDHASQQMAFQSQLKLARIFELPVIIHVREAFTEALAILQSQGPWRHGGVMHCYAGGTEYLEATLGLGFYLGIGGTVTYPKAEGVRQAVREMPLERLFLETDAPYLPPQSFRGKRNEPAWLNEIVTEVAKVRGQEAEELAAITSANACRLFKVAAPALGTLVYEIDGHLYVNLTNRCSANCVFCPRRVSRKLQQYELTLQQEPLAKEVIRAIGDSRRYKEVVFCGFGEPLLRLPVLLQIARAVKSQGGRVRVNTNGQADGIFGRDILGDCQGAVDIWSISMNSMDPQQYFKLVQPSGGPQTHVQVMNFIRRAAALFSVTVTAVELPEINVAAIQQFAKQCGARYRGRKVQSLGEPE
jgi:TatD DNase family protein